MGLHTALTPPRRRGPRPSPTVSEAGGPPIAEPRSVHDLPKSDGRVAQALPFLRNGHAGPPSYRVRNGPGKQDRVAERLVGGQLVRPVEAELARAGPLGAADPG